MTIVAYGYGLSSAVGVGTRIVTGDILVEVDLGPDVEIDDGAVDVEIDASMEVEISDGSVEIEVEDC